MATAKGGADGARRVGFATVGVLVLMLAWDPPLLGPLAGLSFDWSNWNASDIRPMLALDDWPCDPHNSLVHAQSILPLEDATGPESLAFDTSGGGPYTGVADGRILRWDGNQAKWLTFGVTSPKRQFTPHPFHNYAIFKDLWTIGEILDFQIMGCEDICFGILDFQ
jgi:hypothetical protein